MYIHYDPQINASIEKLGRDFPNLNWDFSRDPSPGSHELVSHWPGGASEEVMVNVFQGKKIDSFFLEPQKNKYSDEFIHLEIPDSSPVWKLLGIMALEYANKTEHTQKIIKPMAMSLAMYLSAEYKRLKPQTNMRLEYRLKAYIEMNSDTVTLSALAAHFGYHPVCISRILSSRLGRKFSELVLESRMRKAKTLLELTDLSIEIVANIIGYSNTSNFYKAFRQFYGTSPRKINH